MIKLREACDACGSKELKAYFLGKHIIKIENLSYSNFKVTNKDYGCSVDVVKCNACQLIQPKHVLKSEHIGNFYSGLIDEAYLKSSQMRGESNFNQVFPLIKSFIHSDTQLLEVGAGSGALLKCLKSHVKDLEGIEPNKAFCEYAKETNIKLYATDLDSFLTQKRYDVIIALDVIEHVPSGHAFLEKLYALLKPNGVAIIGTPCIDSFAAIIFRKFWWHIRPMHLFYFSTKAFQKLARKIGFNLGKTAYFYWSLPLSYLWDSFQRIFFRRVLFSLNLTWSIQLRLYDSKLFVLKKER